MSSNRRYNLRPRPAATEKPTLEKPISRGRGSSTAKRQHHKGQKRSQQVKGQQVREVRRREEDKENTKPENGHPDTTAIQIGHKKVNHRNHQIEKEDVVYLSPVPQTQRTDEEEEEPAIYLSVEPFHPKKTNPKGKPKSQPKRNPKRKREEELEDKAEIESEELASEKQSKPKPKRNSKRKREKEELEKKVETQVSPEEPASEEKSEPPKRKRRRRRKKDPAWSTRGSRGGRRRKKGEVKPDLLRMRTDNSKYVKKGDEKSQDAAQDAAAEELSQHVTIEKLLYKSAVMFNLAKLKLHPHIPRDEFRKLFEKKLTEALIASDRPIFSVKFSETNSPISLETPGKNILPRVAKLGFAHFFDNRPITPYSTPVKVSLPDDSEFKESEVYKRILECQDLVKEQEVEITEELLAKTNKEISNLRRTTGKNRSTGQNEKMVKPGVNAKYGSATNYAKESGLFEDIFIHNVRWEWLHLVAHAILGSKSQTDKNLVAGTTPANTAMMFPEGLIELLSKAYPEGFTLRIRAEMVQGMQAGWKLAYTIITKDFELPFEFDLNMKNKPHYNYFLYLKVLVETLIEIARPDLQLNVTQNATTSTTTTSTADAASSSTQIPDASSPSKQAAVATNPPVATTQPTPKAHPSRFFTKPQDVSTPQSAVGATPFRSTRAPVKTGQPRRIKALRGAQRRLFVNDTDNTPMTASPAAAPAVNEKGKGKKKKPIGRGLR